MTHEAIAKNLIRAADNEKAQAILTTAGVYADVELAYALKDICYSSWTNEPTVAQKAAVGLELLSALNSDDEIAALALWINGISDITKGKLETSVKHLRDADLAFGKIGKLHEAAQTKVACMIPLGLLGNYDLATRIGTEALAEFEQLDDELAAGKIEMNLAIVSARQGKHSESKEFCISARDRFARLGETKWLLMAENDLAIALAEMNEFQEAEERYLNALEIAREKEMHLTEAEILASLGNLQTFRGQYGEALRSLELSRKKYAELELPHRSVIADLEIAEIYQILNLTEEAKEIYSGVTEALRDFGMRGEEARARANNGKLAFTTGDFEKSESELQRAAELYIDEGNPAGAATVRLLQSKVFCSRGDFESALEFVGKAFELINTAEFPRLKLETVYMRGETLRHLGRYEEALTILTENVTNAKASEQLSLAANGLVSLAKIAIAKGDLDEAERNLVDAVSEVENLRSPIPAEEFRMAFLADKLAPFELSSEVSLRKNNIERAFSFTEMARSRTLFERLSNLADDRKNGSSGNDGYELQREKLNWFYSRLAREGSDNDEMRSEITRIEKQLAKTLLRDSSVLEKHGVLVREADWSTIPGELIKGLGENRVLIEFTLIEGNISAFVVDNAGIEHFENITTENEITGLLEGLRFQFESMRFNELRDFEPQLKTRANSYLEELYNVLLSPFLKRLKNKDIVFVPVGPLFYVPFCALFDGREHLIETRAVMLAPSAAIWLRLKSSIRIRNRGALVLAFADDKSPLIDREAIAVGDALENSRVFSGATATINHYFDHSEQADMIHLACHGEFRADSPLYSNLRLADGFLTVRDIARQNLNASLVTLSACETGLNEIYAGQEILGLARGFLGAGAANIVMSLWTVNDEATKILMEKFYGALNSRKDAVESLRYAQNQLVSMGRHPYFWASFCIIGE